MHPLHAYAFMSTGIFSGAGTMQVNHAISLYQPCALHKSNVAKCLRVPIGAPEELKPAARPKLLTAMMAVKVGARPSLAVLKQRLLTIHATLLSQRAANRFIGPIRRPQPRTVCETAAEAEAASTERDAPSTS